MATPALLCASVEVALNRILRVEPAAVSRCQALAGRSLVFQASDLGWDFVIVFDKRGVCVSPTDSRSGDVTVRASSLRLVALALQNTGADDAGLPDGLEVQGDTELLRQFSQLLAVAGFDPEEWLAPILGNTAAHRVAEGLHGLLGWARAGVQDIAYSGAEYLREETGDLARSSDAEEWLAGVENLRERLDRFQARLEILEKPA